MEPLDVVSKAIIGITKNYGKKVAKKKTAPEIPTAFPHEITGSRFKLGFGREEIMPDLTLDRTYYIAGHGSGHRMDGILTPVYVHAVYLSCGGEEGILWLSADIVGMTNTEVSLIRERISKSPELRGVRSVNFSSTHSHSGIDTVGYWGKPFASIPSDGKVPEYMELIYDSALRAAVTAFKTAVPGALYTGRTVIPDSLYSKRKFGDRHEVLCRLRFVPDDGGAETWLINFGGHPNSLGGSNRKLSGEYPYFMREEIAKETGANVLFSIGAIGGMDAAMTDDEEPLDRVRYQGGLLAKGAMEIKDEKELEPRIKFLRQQFYMPVSNNVLLLLAMLGTMSFCAYPCAESELGVAMKTEMTYMAIGSQKLLFLPGENFVNTVYGGYLDAEHSPTGESETVNPEPLCRIVGDDSLIAVGVTNDMTGYVVPPNDFILHPGQPYLNSTKDRFGDGHYHETNSMGPKSAATIAGTFRTVVENFGE